MNACLLAIDTATDQLAVGLSTPTGRWCHNAPGGQLSSAALLPAVLGLLAEAGVAMRDLDAVAFGAGPGAFTGLRTACAVAQGLALGAGKPVLAIDSLMLVAEDARLQTAPNGQAPSQADADPDPEFDAGRDTGLDTSRASATDTDWWVAVDARMDEVYAGHYRWLAGPVPGWQVLQAPALYSLALLSALWQQQPPRQVAGNASSVFGQRLPLAGVRCHPDQHDRAAALLRLAAQAWPLGRAVDAADALPLYLRDKVALTTAERAQRAAVP